MVDEESKLVFAAVSGFIPFGSYFGGCGTAIAAGSPPWVIGCSQVDARGDAGIYKSDAQGWAQYPGAAVSIALSPTGVAWVMNASGGIYRWDGTKLPVGTCRRRGRRQARFSQHADDTRITFVPGRWVAAEPACGYA